VELLGILAQAQRAVQTNGVTRFIQGVGLVAGLGKPEVADKIDGDFAVDYLADGLGVDPRMLVDDRKVAQVRTARAQQQAAAAQAAQGSAVAEGASKLAKVPTQGGASNAGADAIGMFSGYGSPQAERIANGAFYSSSWRIADFANGYYQDGAGNWGNDPSVLGGWAYSGDPITSLSFQGELKSFAANAPPILDTGLLAANARQNLQTYSGDPTAWAGTGAVFTTQQMKLLDGSVASYAEADNTPGSNSFIQPPVIVPALSTTYTRSILVQSVWGAPLFAMENFDGVATTSSIFNLSTGVASGSNSPRHDVRRRRLVAVLGHGNNGRQRRTALFGLLHRRLWARPRHLRACVCFARRSSRWSERPHTLAPVSSPRRRRSRALSTEPAWPTACPPRGGCCATSACRPGSTRATPVSCRSTQVRTRHSTSTTTASWSAATTAPSPATPRSPADARHRAP
jgi:hypothetical protein